MADSTPFRQEIVQAYINKMSEAPKDFGAPPTHAERMALLTTYIGDLDVVAAEVAKVDKVWSGKLCHLHASLKELQQAEHGTPVEDVAKDSSEVFDNFCDAYVTGNVMAATLEATIKIYEEQNPRNTRFSSLRRIRKVIQRRLCRSTGDS